MLAQIVDNIMGLSEDVFILAILKQLHFVNKRKRKCEKFCKCIIMIVQHKAITNYYFEKGKHIRKHGMLYTDS